MNVQHQEHIDYVAGLQSAGDYDRSEAEMGAMWNDNWQDEYILSSRDVWYRNPHYHGPEGLHPEDDGQYEMNDVDLASQEKYNREYAEYWAEQVAFDQYQEMIERGGLL